MATTRIQGIKVSSSLDRAINHRLYPSKLEELIFFFRAYDPLLVSSEFRKLDKQLLEHYNLPDDIITNPDKNSKEYLKEFIKMIESKLYKHKIRKNSTIQEIIIAYSPEEKVNKDIIFEDLLSFEDSFRKKYGFIPFYTAFVHKDEKEKYHIHILFSLVNPQLERKVRWRKKDYFDLIRNMSKISPRIHISSEKKGIGAYPLWMIRRIEAKIGRNKAKQLIKEARKQKIRASKLLEWVEDQIKRENAIERKLGGSERRL